MYTRLFLLLDTLSLLKEYLFQTWFSNLSYNRLDFPAREIRRVFAQLANLIGLNLRKIIEETIPCALHDILFSLASIHDRRLPHTVNLPFDMIGEKKRNGDMRKKLEDGEKIWSETQWCASRSFRKIRWIRRWALLIPRGHGLPPFFFPANSPDKGFLLRAICTDIPGFPRSLSSTYYWAWHY